MAPSKRVEAAQPAADQVWDYENRWNRGFSECCENCGTCCYAYFCFCCFVGGLFRRTNECCGMVLCLPCSLMGLRAKLRTGFRIKGSLCRDCVAAACCTGCVAIQIKHELDIQEL